MSIPLLPPIPAAVVMKQEASFELDWWSNRTNCLEAGSLETDVLMLEWGAALLLLKL